MADSNKPVRLSKAAREFNLGMTTVVEFLASKGIEVEAKPNTKLDPETYALVKSNFQGDKETKAKAQASAASIQERESITLASAKKRVAPKQEEEEPEIDLSQFKKSEAAPVVKRTQTPTEAPKVAAKEEPAQEPAAQEEAPAKDGPKVVGKVDLEALKPKKKPRRKQTQLRHRQSQPSQRPKRRPRRKRPIRLNRKWCEPKPKNSQAPQWWARLSCPWRRRKGLLGTTASASA